MKKETKVLNLTDYRTKADVKYRDMVEFKKSIPDDLNMEDMDTNFLMMRILKVFYDINPNVARQLKQEQIEILVDKIYNIIQQPEATFKNIIHVGDKPYGFIPNFQDITVGELIDLDEMLKQQDIIALTSILYRPIIGNINSKGEYQIEEYNGYDKELFKDVTWDIVEGYMGLFTRSIQELSHLIVTSSEKTDTQMTKTQM